MKTIYAWQIRQSQLSPRQHTDNDKTAVVIAEDVEAAIATASELGVRIAQIRSITRLHAVDAAKLPNPAGGEDDFRILGSKWG